MSDIEPGRLHRAIEPLQSLSYFAPELDEALVAVGLRPGRMCYLAARSAPMGAVGAGVVAATFYNFNPELVARHLPRAWTLAMPAEVIAARWRAAGATLRRLLGAEAAGSEQIAEAAELARTAIDGVAGDGRPLYAAHAEVPWPAEALLALWHAVTLLREHRGDGHIAALVDADLSGCEAIVTHTATGNGFLEPAAKRLRAWSDDQWDAACERLRSRGILDTDGTLTGAGQALRARVEDGTDRMAAAPWARLGADGASRLYEIARPLSKLAIGNGAFPPGVFARRSAPSDEQPARPAPA